MKKFWVKISEGLAVLTETGIRCYAVRKNKPDWRCGQLVAKYNSAGQLGVSVKCPRCGQLIETIMVDIED